jgi:hypothetical protein
MRFVESLELSNNNLRDLQKVRFRKQSGNIQDTFREHAVRGEPRAFKQQPAGLAKGAFPARSVVSQYSFAQWESISIRLISISIDMKSSQYRYVRVYTKRVEKNYTNSKNQQSFFGQTASIVLTACLSLPQVLPLLEHMRFLYQLEMKGNPCCEEPDYRLHVLHKIPSLHILDSHEVTTAEQHQTRVMFGYDLTSTSVAFGKRAPEKPERCPTMPLGAGILVMCYNYITTPGGVPH